MRYISIPFGAIKSDEANKRSEQIWLFQFLLVRLKDTTRQLLMVMQNISIPFGAIKRSDQIEINKVIYEFQFLLVRLKVFSF